MTLKAGQYKKQLSKRQRMDSLIQATIKYKTHREMLMLVSMPTMYRLIKIEEDKPKYIALDIINQAIYIHPSYPKRCYLEVVGSRVIKA